MKKVTGSHHIYTKAGENQILSIPVHRNQDLKIGTLRAIMKVAQLSSYFTNGILKKKMPNTIIDQFFSYVSIANIDDAIALTTDDVIFEAQGPSEIPIYGSFHGHKGVRDFFATLSKIFDTEAFEIRTTIENNTAAFGYGYMQHRVKATDQIFKSEWALYCSIRDGKIEHYRMFEDTARLCDAYLQ